MRVVCGSGGVARLGVVAVTVVIACLMAGVPTVAAPGGGWGANVKVNQGPSTFIDQFEPSIVVDSQGRLFVGWIEIRSADGLPGAEPVAFSRSVDRGTTWSLAYFMSFLQTTTTRRQSDPWLAIDERDRVYFSRLEFNSVTPWGPQGVVVSRSDDAGVTWATNVNAADDPNNYVDKDTIVSDRMGTMYLSYLDLTTSTLEARIKVTHSFDRGATWSPTSVVNDNGLNVEIGSVMGARPDGAVSIVWWDLSAGNIFADSSTDYGTTWGRDILVNDVPGTARTSVRNSHAWPSIVQNSKGTLFVAWTDMRNGNEDIYVATSRDRGKTWSPGVRVNDDLTKREQYDPVLAIDAKDKLHIAWYDNRTGNYNVYYSTSSDGRAWSLNERVTDSETPYYLPPGHYLGLAVDRRGNVYAAWTDGRNLNYDIYFARRTMA